MKKPSEGLRVSNTTQWLKSEDFQFLCFDFAREQMTFDEPIPDYSTRDNALLESALGTPMQTFDGKLLYPFLIEQASVLFYSLIKNHPFRNGNKRIAVMSLLVFLALNAKWLSISPMNLYRLAKKVASTNPQDREKSITLIEQNIKTYLIDFPVTKTSK